MTGFGVFLRKEVMETRRTWRMWVLPGVLLFFAVTGALMARYTKEILEALPAQPGQPEIVVPDPTYVDAYAGWLSNLGQLAVFVLLVQVGGAVAGERKRGTAVLMLTKPLSRESFVWAKFVAHFGLTVVATALGTAVTWVLTQVLFDRAPVGPLVEAAALWLVFAALVVAFMLCTSAWQSSTAGAAGLGFALFVVLGILSLLSPVTQWSFVGLLTAPTQILTGKDPALLMPVLTAVVATVALLWLAPRVLARKEL